MPGPINQNSLGGSAGSGSASSLTVSEQRTLDHIEYNPTTGKLEADRPIETTLNSFFLGDQHKMSSGSENIYFTNLTTNINFYPAWGGIKDQGLVANQDMSGVIVPSGRVFTAYGVLPLGGNPVAGTQVAYDGDNYFPNNISGLGITTVVAEVVPSNVRLKYELSVDGTPVYVQFLEHNGLGVDEPLSWTFDHPLDVNAGSTNHASITKIAEDDTNLGLLLVCRGDDGTGRYQTTVANRGYNDKNIAFTEDLESLDVVGFYDIYVDPTFAGTADGTNLRPYTTITEAINASSANNKIFIKGIINVTAAVDLPHSLHFYGIDGSEIRYASYNAANGSIFTFTGTDYTQSFTFVNIAFRNAGAYGLYLKKTGGIRIENCEFANNGWSGTGLSTVLAAAEGALGYDSSAAELQAFYAGPNASNGGAMRIEECVAIEVIGNKVQKNLRGIRIQDCGVGGYGFVTRNVASQNIESGIYIAAGGTYGGSQNIIVTMNSSAYNANNGLLVIGGLNNKFSQNEVNGNWNAGFCAWGAANSTLRDCGLYDNNRSQYNGIGNTGDAKASIQINEAYNLLGTSISLNPAARFIAEILDTQVHYTGLGSNTEKIGFLITSGVGALADDDKNIIKVDDVGFIGQDYAIDLSEVDVTNLRLSLGDNSYQTIVVAAVKPPLSGNYSELPFSNHVMSIPSVNIEIDVLKQMVSLREYVSGNVINTYKANELQSVEHASHINIIQRNSDKIQLRGLTLGNVYVNGVAAGNTVNSMSNTVNAAFAMDLTEYKEFLVSEVGVNAGGTLPAQADNYFIAYGTRAAEQITAAGVIADIEDQQPFYNGNFLEKGHEYTWTHNNNGSYMLGVWSGASSTHDETTALSTTNWTPGFRFVRSSNRFSGSASAAVDISTRLTAGDNASVTTDGQYNVVDGSTVLALRYGNDNYLYLLDITGGDEFVIGRSNTTLVGDNVTIFFAGENQPNAQFPVMQERTERWTFVHDFDSSESGEWADGIESDSVLRSNLSFSPGEKVTINFNYFARSESIGFGYTGASSGLNNAYNQISQRLFYNTQEVLKAGDTIAATGGDWTWNASATHYYNPNGDGSDVGYSNNGGVGNLGLISWRYKNDNTLELWHETNNELIATLTAPLDGSDYNVYFGANEAHPAGRIPTLNKYDLTAVENNNNVSTWYYIESPDGVYIYPLFNNEANAQTIDAVEGGTGAASGFSFPDEPTGATWYGPDTSMVTNGSHAPSHGVYGNSTNIIWNEIPTNADSTAAPTPFTDAAVTLDELAALNFQIHPLGATFTTTIQSAPAWISQATANANATGTAPAVSGDNISFPSVDYTLTVVRTNAYGSSTGTLTITVNNLTTPASLPGTLHAGSIVDSSATNSAGKIYLQVTGGHVVYDFPTALADGDKLEWYHQDGSYVFGIAAAGVDKTTDLADHDADNSAKWDLAAPITGSPTHDNGQNFGNNFSTTHIGMVPLGWDDNTNPQTIPTRPVYASSDVWKLYNNAGTIELSLNGVLFRSSSSTHTDPVITFAVSEISGSGGVVTHTEMPTFTHTADQASAPTGFTLLSGTMDTSDKLNGNSAVSVNNLTLSPGQRLIATKAWWNTNVLPFLDGASGEDNKVFLGVAKDLAGFDSIVEQDFYASHRVESQTANLTKITQYYAGPTPAQMNINRSSDTDVHYNMAIEFTREGDLVTMRSPDTDPSLTTEPVGGTFGQTQTWTGAHAVVGTGAQDIVLATKEAETRVKVVESGLSVITAPSKANEFDVTEDTFSAPLFNGDPAGDITLAAGSTYKFWMHSDTIESTDTLQICLVSDSSVYSTGVTTVGTPGSFGAYVEFDIPADVPPVKFKWTSGGSAYYATPVVSGSTYSVGVTGVAFEGPAANQSGSVIVPANGYSKHGWISLDETLAAGQRLILSNAFFTDLLTYASSQTGYTDYEFAIGLKGDSWANTQKTTGSNSAQAGIFKGDAYLSIRITASHNVRIKAYANGTASNEMLVNTPALHATVCAFLDITSTGNNIRLGFGRNGNGGITAGDESTQTYADWNYSKVQSGNQGYGISQLDVLFLAYNSWGATAEFDADEIDWTELTEIAIPVAPTITTDWNKAVDFSGSNERIVQVNDSVNFNAIRMSGSSTTVGAPSAGYTSSSTAARPWACVVVFKSDRHSSNQHIWNSGEGASTDNDNIFLRQDASGNIYFSWGRDGSGYNECRIAQTISSSTWYGVYIASNGTRLSGSNASASNLASAFDIRMMSSADSFATLGSNLSTSANWIDTGSRMDRSVTGSFTIGGRGSNRNFHGKVASTVVTTLRRNVLMPADSEIKLMITDPKKWEDDHLDGQTIRYGNGGSDVAYNPSISASGYGAVQIWLMGDGLNDSYSNGIRNQVYSTDQNYTKLQFNSMSSNDIETVSILGLT